LSQVAVSASDQNPLLRLPAVGDNAAMEREWYQFSLRTLFAVMTLVAIACGTYSLLGPPFIRTYREAMQWHYMPNLDWWVATLCELYAVRIWVGYRQRRARRCKRS
jgi:hypothetical protein